MKKQIIKKALSFVFVTALCVPMLATAFSLFTFNAGAASSAITATYTAIAGFPAYSADGSVAITVNSGAVPSTYRIYYGNSSGKLAGYKAFRDIAATGTTTYFSLPSYSIVPSGADRLLVYSVSGSTESLCATAMLTGKQNTFGAADKEVQFISDIHVQSTLNHVYSQRFTDALADIKSISPNTQGIFIAGDIADGDMVADPNKWEQPFPEQYVNFKTIVNNAGLSDKLFVLAGNHDFFAWNNVPTYEEMSENCVEQFLTGTGLEKMYYYKDIGGTRFIMMGSSALLDSTNRAFFTSEQMQWFKQSVDSAPDGPIVVFCHSAFGETVAGTKKSEYPGEIYHGTSHDTELREILDANPEIIWVSGHSHERLEMPDNLYKDDTITALNASSVAYILEHGGNTSDQGSQGFFAYFYGNTIVLKGYDFLNNQWIPEAQLVIDDSKAEKTEVTLEWTAPENLEYDARKKIPSVVAKVNGQVVATVKCELNSGSNTYPGTFTFKAVGFATGDAYYSLPSNVISPEYTIVKGTPSATQPNSISADPGVKLSTLKLPSRFSWDAPDTVVSHGTKEYSATYTPSNTNNYKTLSFKVTVEAHTLEAEWSSDANSHWKACTVAGCTEQLEEAEHRFSGGACRDCGYKEAVATTPTVTTPEDPSVNATTPSDTGNNVTPNDTTAGGNNTNTTPSGTDGITTPSDDDDTKDKDTDGCACGSAIGGGFAAFLSVISCGAVLFITKKRR